MSYFKKSHTHKPKKGKGSYVREPEDIMKDWPDWKREFEITQYSKRDNPYARAKNFPEDEVPPNGDMEDE